jgi:prevent-host-death family protein
MATVTIHEAKTQLSRLIARAEGGEEIVIARGDDPVVRLTPIKAARRRPTFGALKGQLTVPDAFFFDPLPEEILASWEGRDEDSAR